MRLSNLAQDFLDLARLELGRLRIARDPVDVVALLHDLVNLQEAQAAARGITLSLDMPDPLPPIDGDQDRLTQVFMNPLANAINQQSRSGAVTTDMKTPVRRLRIERAEVIWNL